jgi:hypothetical protein
MKTTILLFLLLPSFAFAQDTTTIEQYCEVTIGPGGLFSNKVTLAIDHGNMVRRALTDYRLRDSRDELITFNTRVDALNYMGRQGWILVNALSAPADANGNRYLFKKRVAAGLFKNDVISHGN